MKGEGVVTLAMDDGELTGMVGAGGLFLLCIVVVWQVAVTWRARMLAAREEQYRALAEKYANLLEDNVELQRRMAEDLASTQQSVMSMERMMREIE
ncbi:hypothetical protein [Streptomyces clavuligerus]|uniref:Secreted protein n=1 Tax=Streptomyces clavuligerus TaxID=1901 RepID=E2QAB9_STRCL|nr:hypothetical protein [Streptomyces clavuligerus]ANW17662.1 hypothetical protein BB341_05180 [Streptomyces clavuligerus]AXU12210.1 hypothetical protein D1794_05370 [Streptomyces clavuligerus]EFG09818.1 Hypothetical protein SCLAV_4746 [Streptomyces clavuligerus]MBY6302080.1 hypothetical protein [Streptomyces clavuligerus]QCS04992.1 hypothetical protein CRV15_04790 [Streptomyces clavuligerus]